MPWEEAKKKATSLGGALATIRTGLDNAEINKLSCVIETKSVWIGGYRNGDNFMMLPSFGSAIETAIWGPATNNRTYTNWAPGRPNSQTSDCLSIFGGILSDEIGYLWDDGACMASLFFVVEYWN